MPASYGPPVESLVSDPSATDPPSLVDGVLRYRRSIVILSFTEERLMLLLLESGSMAVSRVDAATHAARGRPFTGRAFDSLVARLRAKLAGTGITIRSEPSRRLVIELSG